MSTLSERLKTYHNQRNNVVISFYSRIPRSTCKMHESVVVKFS